jgi:hypothetical protein
METPKIGEVIQKVNGKHTGAAPRIRRMKLDHPDLSDSQIAKAVGCDPANVTRVLKRFLGKRISEAEHTAFKDNLPDILERSQHRILMSVSDQDIAKASLLQRATAFGILEDKKRNIRGQSTSVNVTVLLDAVNAIREMRSKE